MNRVQTENKNYVRDIHSRALLATDKESLYRHRKERAELNKLRDDYHTLRDTVHKMKDDLAFLKNFILSRGDNNGS
jgi:cell division protein FtsB